MAFTKNDQAVVLNRESLQYLANCIRLVHSLPDLLNDVLPSQTTTYSSYKVTELLNTLNTDLQNYVNNALGNLSHLKKEIVSVAPTDSSADEDTIYLVQDASGGYEQYLKINGVVTSLGSTSAMANVYTKSESDSKFALLSTLNSLITVVGGLNDLTTTDKTSIVNAINELKTSVTALENKSTMVTLTQAEYNQLVADGKVDNDTYYIISDDSENLDLNKFNIKTYTRLEQIGLSSGCTVEEIYSTLPNDSYFECGTNTTYDNTPLYVINNLPNQKGGLLTIRKSSKNVRNTIEYRTTNGGGIMTDLYIAQFKGYDSSGLSWKKVCTTSVADVPYTKITNYADKTNIIAGTGFIEYRIKNGICYVNINGIKVPASYIPNTTIILSSELPPATIVQRNNSMDGSFSYNGGVAIADKLMATITTSDTYIHSTLSYPVAES